MRTRLAILGSTMLLALAVLFACAQPNKQLYYGTWISDKSIWKKSVRTTDGEIKNYARQSDATPTEVANEKIAACWLDSEGNTWFRIETTVIEGPFLHTMPKAQILAKVSKSGDSLEVEVRGTMEFSPNGFPSKLDPTSQFYQIYKRAEE